MVGGSILAAPLAVAAQQTRKVPRIGVLVPAEPESLKEPNIAAFRRTLRDLSYVDGQNVAVEYRWAHGKAELYPELVTLLVGLNVDVLVVGSGPATLATKRATQTIPIVGVSMGGDPVGAGLVASLARPGGNVTGVSGLLGGGFVGKWVELLKEAARRITRVSALRDASNPISGRFLPDLQAAAQALGLKHQAVAVRELGELDGIFAAMSKEMSSGLVVFGEARFFPHRSRLDLHVHHTGASWRMTTGTSTGHLAYG